MCVTGETKLTSKHLLDLTEDWLVVGENAIEDLLSHLMPS